MSNAHAPLIEEDWKQSWLELLANAVSLSESAQLGIGTHLTVMHQLVERVERSMVRSKPERSNGCVGLDHTTAEPDKP